MAKSSYAFISQPIGRFRDPEARDISSAINTAITQTAFLDDPALTDAARGGALTASDFDVLQLKRKPTTVYLIRSAAEDGEAAALLLRDAKPGPQAHPWRAGPAAEKSGRPPVRPETVSGPSPS